MYKPSISTRTQSRNAWEELIDLGRDIGPDAILKGLKTTDVGTLYILRATTTDFYKIGFSSNPDHAETRKRNLQTGCPFKLEIVLSVNTFYFRYIEKFLHIVYSSQNTQGEWFELSGTDVDNIKKFVDGL